MRARFVLLFLFLLPFASALAPSSATITVVLSQDGTASVREEYYFFFSDKNEMNEFLSLAQEIGDVFQLWIARIDGVDFHVGRQFSDLKDISIYWMEISDNAAKLTVRYTTKAAVLIRDTPLESVYMLNRFHFPVVSGAIVIPTGYSITVVLPPSARVVSYEPEMQGGQRTQSIIAWEGPVTTNRLYVEYTIPKPASAPSIVEILSNASYSTYIGVALLLLAALLFFRWREIRRIVRRYVEENTHFEE